MLYAEFNGPFWGHWEDKHAERNAKRGGLRECVRCSAHRCEQVLDKKQFKEEAFILTDSLRGPVNTGRHDGRGRGTAGHIAAIAKKRNMNVTVLPWIKSPTPAHGMSPPQLTSVNQVNPSQT